MTNLNRFNFRIYDDTTGLMGYFHRTYDPFSIMTLPCSENIMQCTGKKDCAGKLIYEEDIVTLTGTNGMVFTYVVKFKDYAFVLEYLDGKRARYFHKQYAQPKCLYKEGYRVIGNIYQNPDLLK